MNRRDVIRGGITLLLSVALPVAYFGGQRRLAFDPKFSPENIEAAQDRRFSWFGMNVESWLKGLDVPKSEVELNDRVEEILAHLHEHLGVTPEQLFAVEAKHSGSVHRWYCVSRASRSYTTWLLPGGPDSIASIIGFGKQTGFASASRR